ncbi:hypothetical protein DPMN_124656 [Dreissena polymorpha]|uniref:Uncharacterized protein n=1 Tax=Dreissena polymorpha TaxID=45954 RepID=A0A9D4GT10_DREPO|nr:hypothetical protein DPMN_124656 [Dreissena polymorpha]
MLLYFRFPPAGQYVGSWPQQLWEVTLANIGANLYGLVHGGTYIVRAFSSLIGDIFFLELTLNDKGGHGTVSSKEFGEFFGRSIEQLQVRLDLERNFKISLTGTNRNIDKACSC